MVALINTQGRHLHVHFVYATDVTAMEHTLINMEKSKIAKNQSLAKIKVLKKIKNTKKTKNIRNIKVLVISWIFRLVSALDQVHPVD